MDSRTLPVYSTQSFSATRILLLSAMAVCCAFAAPVPSGGADFDIPLSELSKVKKESPPKRVIKEVKKKKIDARKQEPPSDTAEPIVPAEQPKTQTVGASVPVPAQPETVTTKTPAPSKPAPENIRIHHVPYSFVVAGKRTVIQAVINSEADIQAVNCAIHGGAGGAKALIKMEKVGGTQFTYTTNLPGLAPENPFLLYTIIVVDSTGRETRSQEFVTPVTSSPVVPGWQLEDAPIAASIKQEGEKKALEAPAKPVLPPR